MISRYVFKQWLLEAIQIVGVLVSENAITSIQKTPFKCSENAIIGFKKKKIGHRSSAVTGVILDDVAGAVQALLRHHFQAHQRYRSNVIFRCSNDAVQAPFSSTPSAIQVPFSGAPAALLSCHFQALQRRHLSTIQGAFQAPFKVRFRHHSRRALGAIQGTLQEPFKARFKHHSRRVLASFRRHLVQMGSAAKTSLQAAGKWSRSIKNP